MDMVLLLNTYCNLKNKQQYWEIYYYTHGPMDTTTFRQMLQAEEGDDDDEDLSHLP
jgi:hypothetical protein